MIEVAKELGDVFGWELGRMAEDAKHAYDGRCSDCGCTFASMVNGLFDLTLDVRQPTDPPYYGTNTAWICQTCNRAKGRTPLHLWGAKRQGWRVWHEHEQAVESGRASRLPLWDLESVFE